MGGRTRWSSFFRVFTCIFISLNLMTRWVLRCAHPESPILPPLLSPSLSLSLSLLPLHFFLTSALLFLPFLVTSVAAAAAHNGPTKVPRQVHKSIESAKTRAYL